MKERIHWLDLAKGIAIILVVIGHVVSSYHEAGLFKNNVLFNFSHQLVYSFHMALFMMVSGFFASRGNKEETNTKKVLKKLINYGIPYVLFSAVWVIMKLLLSQYTNKTVSFIDLALIPIYPISFMWFIYALLIMQIIQIYLSPISKMGKVIHLLIALIGYFIQPYLAVSLIEIRFSDCVISDFLKNYVFFLIGVYLLEYVAVKLEKRKEIVGILSGTILIAGNALKYFGIMGNSRVFTFLLALSGSLFVVELCIILKSNRFLEYLGKHSLPIYVLQGMVIAASRLSLTRLGLNIGYGIVPLVVCSVLGCFLPLCVYWLSTKIWKLDGCFYPGRYLKV